MNTAHMLVIFATVLNAMLVGAALDQHIEQLPARHRIGVVAFSEYSKAADLSNGVAWYVQPRYRCGLTRRHRGQGQPRRPARQQC